VPATELFCHLLGINPKKLSKRELRLLEADLFVRICRALKEYFRKKYKSYFYFMKYSVDKENLMLEENFIRYILNDILLTEEYTVKGIAHYVGTHEDVINDIASGINTKPTAYCYLRIIEIHRSVKKDIYKEIAKKITEDIKNEDGDD